MEQSPSGEFKMSSANQKILHILRNPEYHFRITSAATCPYPEPDQSIPCLPISLLQEYFNIILPLMRRFSKWSLSTTSLHRNPTCTSTVSNTCHIPHLSHFSWFIHSNIWWGIHKIQLNFWALKGLSIFPLELILSVFCDIGGTVDLDKSKALQVSNRFPAYLLRVTTFNFTVNDQDLPTYVNKSPFYASVCTFYPSQ